MKKLRMPFFLVLLLSCGGMLYNFHYGNKPEPDVQQVEALPAQITGAQKEGLGAGKYIQAYVTRVLQYYNDYARGK